MLSLDYYGYSQAAAVYSDRQFRDTREYLQKIFVFGFSPSQFVTTEFVPCLGRRIGTSSAVCYAGNVGQKEPFFLREDHTHHIRKIRAQHQGRKQNNV